MKIEINNLDYFGIPNKKTFLYEYKKENIILQKSVLVNLLEFILKRYWHNYKDYEQVEINSRQFSKVQWGYAPYLSYLKDKEIILINKYFVIGECSRKYYFTNKFKKMCEITIVNENYDNEIITIKTNCNEEIKNKLFNDFKEIKLRNEYVGRTLIERIPMESYDLKKFLYNKLYMDGLKKGIYHYKWDVRLYTSFTQLSNHIRLGSIYFGDDKLSSRDIPNSFPLFLAFWLKDKDVNKNEYNDYSWGLNNGKFYNKFIEKFGYEFEREQIKNMFQIWLNGDNNRKTMINLKMYELYPSIHKIICAYKLENKNKLFYALAELEADFVFNTICSRVYSEIEGIKLLTCHDEIYYEKKYEGQIEKIWTEELKKINEKV